MSMSFLIPSAFAAEKAAVHTAAAGEASKAAAHASPLSSTLMMIIFFGVFIYFFLWRPQSRRAKSQQDMLSKLQVEDEIVTAGGMVGKIKSIDDGILKLAINAETIIHIQRNAVANVLPKGTVKF